MAPDIQLLWLIDPESDDEVADPRSVSTARPVTGSDARHRAGSLARQRPKNRERRRRGDHALARAPRSGDARVASAVVCIKVSSRALFC